MEKAKKHLVILEGFRVYHPEIQPIYFLEFLVEFG